MHLKGPNYYNYYFNSLSHCSKVGVCNFQYRVFLKKWTCLKFNEHIGTKMFKKFLVTFLVYPYMKIPKRFPLHCSHLKMFVHSSRPSDFQTPLSLTDLYFSRVHCYLVVGQLTTTEWLVFLKTRSIHSDGSWEFRLHHPHSSASAAWSGCPFLATVGWTVPCEISSQAVCVPTD